MSEPREIELRSARGERLAGLLHEAEMPRGLVLLSPCFTCTRDIAPVRNLARDLAEAGFTACRFDPAGSGKSEGRFEDATLGRYVEDLVAVARALAPTVEPASGGSERPRAVPLHLVGHSLGGATSILAAAALGPATVVTLGTNARKDSLRRLLGEEAFERARTEGSFLFDAGDGVLRPLTRAFVSDLERQDVLGAAEHLACPLLVVHGDHDSLVPLDAARELASCARADLAVVPGGEHLLSSRADRASVRAAVLAFLARQG